MNKITALLLLSALSLFSASPSYFQKNGFEPLTGIQFADSLTGWACGQKGTILYTTDGGDHWQSASVPHPFFVEKLCFVNKRVGWAVGGITTTEAAEYPGNYYTYGTRHAMGAILHTQDGGVTWHQDSVNSQYPEVFHRPTAWLLDVDFVDSLRGWACGSFQSMYRTVDGGAHWEQLNYDGLNRWDDLNSGKWYYAMDFVDSLTGYVAGEDSIIMKSVDGGRRWTYLRGPVDLINTGSTPQSYSEGKRYTFFRTLRFVSPSTGWVMGDNGNILKTGDSGRTWVQATLPFPAAFMDLADIKGACFLNADTGYAVSHAGGGLLKTVDGGAHWAYAATGFEGWFNAVCFTDARHGWMAGECGMVLHTSDGGATWTEQRGPVKKNGSLAPILVIHAHGDDEVIWGGGCLAARYGLNEGVPVVGLRMTKDTRYKNLYRQGEVKRYELRTADGVAGYSGHRTLDEFDTDGYTNYATELAHWGGSDDVLMAELVHAIRIWRPMAVLTHDSVYGEYNKQNHITGGMIATKAWHAAGDSTRFPEHRVATGLPAWEPKKLYFFRLGPAPTASTPHFRMNWDEVVRGTGFTLKQHADQALQSYLSQNPSGLQAYVDQCSLFVRMECKVTASVKESEILEGTGYPLINAEKAVLQVNGAPALQCLPNPFYPGTRVVFGLRQPSRVTVEVFNVRGERVALLLNRAEQPAGMRVLAWRPEGLATGIYSIRIRSSEGVRMVRAMLVR